MMKWQVGDKVVAKPHLLADLINFGIKREVIYVIDHITSLDATFFRVRLLHGDLLDFWIHSKYWTRVNSTFVIEVQEC